MLDVVNVSKIYKKGGQEIKAIDNVSLSIQKGEFVSLVGPKWEWQKLTSSHDGRNALTYIWKNRLG